MQGKSLKTIKKIYSPRIQNEGAGAKVMRVIGGSDVPQCDPFLMLDYFNTKLPAGFPDHPHRGFETITYMKKGSMHHEDFMGNKGVINPGDIQWMTAGKGIVHAEMPGSFDETSEGFQLWLNLSAKNKFIDPSYQEYKADQLPVVKKEGIDIKLIAGESYGEKGPINARTPAYYQDVQIQKNVVYEQIIPKNWNALIFIFEGEAFFGDDKKQKANKLQAVLFNNESAELLKITAGNEGLKFLLMAGQPLNEPIVQHGPFVLNTQQQLQQTFEDYQYYKNGFEHRKNWESKIQDFAEGKF